MRPRRAHARAVWDTFRAPPQKKIARTVRFLRSDDACIVGAWILTAADRHVTLASIFHHRSHCGRDGLERDSGDPVTDSWAEYPPRITTAAQHTA